MAPNEQKGLGLAITALVAFGAMMVWVLTDSPTSKGTSAEPQAARKPPATETAAPTKRAGGAGAPSIAAANRQPAASPAVDLFAGELPAFMQTDRERIEHKQWLEADDQRELYNFGKAHPHDARPQLLLAWDSMNREWDGIAVRMYAIAYHADKRAEDDPSMLRDLIDVASRFDSVEHREATDIIKEAYGSEALARIDARLTELRTAGELMRAARVQRLRNAIVPH